MRIAFIGAGKVATSISIYLYNKGFRIAGYYSRSRLSAEKAALNTKSQVFANIKDLLEGADLIAVTTPDDVIIDIAAELIEIQTDWKNKAVFHMSGVHSSNIFGRLDKKAAAIFSLHPMLAFSDLNSDDKILKTAIFTLEGKGEKFSDLKKFLHQWGNQIVEIETENKVLYHAAGSVVSNYMVTLLDIGIKMLVNAGFNEKNAINIIRPLVQSTFNNIVDYGTEQALTGPISRGDLGTVEKHVIKIGEIDKGLLEVYKVLGIKTVELAKRTERISVDLGLEMEEVLMKNG